MDHREYRPRLIRNQRTAIVALVSTGFLAVLTFRTVVSHSSQQSHWLLPLDFVLTGRALLAVNVAFYTYLLWLCTVFLRIAQGKERILVAGCFPGILLTPSKVWFQSVLPAAFSTSKPPA